MIWEALGSAALGGALALAATRRFPERLPDRRLVLATGPVAALAGGLISRTVLGSGHLAVVWCLALGFSAALLSLLLRDDSPRRRQWRQDALRTAPAPAGASAGFGQSADFRQQAPGLPSASYGPR
ncbi:hypothetical protein ABZ686_29095 [Streptomyces sp. NPDC006992]|uniref:hypothetical protein n=1 Tax=unclassified Streptomyces TaxID=2593676 RepID=UPI0033F27673